MNTLETKVIDMIKTDELEEKYKARILEKMLPYFDATPEVTSIDNKSRIDYLLKVKDQDAYFGLECKRFDKKKGEGVGEYIKQAYRYAKADFLINGNATRVPIFIAPALSLNYLVMNEHEIITKHEGVNKTAYIDRHQDFHTHHTVNGMLGAFGIGEVRKKASDNKKFQSFYFSMSNSVIWSSAKKWQSQEIYGLHLENYQKLLKKINSL